MRVLAVEPLGFRQIVEQVNGPSTMSPQIRRISRGGRRLPSVISSANVQICRSAVTVEQSLVIPGDAPGGNSFPMKLMHGPDTRQADTYADCPGDVRQTELTECRTTCARHRPSGCIAARQLEDHAPNHVRHFRAQERERRAKIHRIAREKSRAILS